MRVWLRVTANNRLTELGAAFWAHALDILTRMDSTRPSRFQPSIGPEAEFTSHRTKFTSHRTSG